MTRGIYDEAIRFIEQHQDRPFYINVGVISRIIRSIHRELRRQVQGCRCRRVQVCRTDARKVCGVQGARGRRERAYAAIHGGYPFDGRGYCRLLRRVDELGFARQYDCCLFQRSRPSPARCESFQGPEARKKRGKNAKPSSAEMEYSRLDAMVYAGIYRVESTAFGKVECACHGSSDGQGHVPAGRVDEKVCPQWHRLASYTLLHCWREDQRP